MPNLVWSNLGHLQLGRYAEYYAKMEFASYGYEIYTSEVDDHGVDFVARIDGVYHEVQVKSFRKAGYVFIPKTLMDVEDKTRLVCLLRFEDNVLPEVFVIPAVAWKQSNAVLVSRDYEGSTKSKPE